ncbi:MAG: HPr-rel-A system PqqD family peptide chaperone [Bacteroidales bacterium]|jgi:PqqD family protein of HPr-rel-A system|nr:HPr-rel-A system PqqD family peptide chaperone [Bacteroidales bacterium]NPV35876.1 HPr-rel-A system PqqD family peptide chaperone [Bacteroidales bacterium]
MKINPNLAINDTGFAFDPMTGHSYTLNSVALEIVQRLKQGQTEEEIATGLADEFDADPVIILKDLLDFIEILRNYELLEHE